MTAWKKYKLGEIADVQTGPFGSQLHNRDYVEYGTPIITVEHLGKRKISRQNLPCVSEQDRNRLAKYSLTFGDLVFSRVGSVDRCSIVTDEEVDWLFSGRCLRVRKKNTNIVDNHYLYYFFCLESTKETVRKIAVGATMPSINTEILSNIVISAPDLPTQHLIAQILTSLDDKIELLGQMNQTLETMAQTIFKEWFIDFNFPGFDGDLVDGLPKGWRKGKLGEVCYVQNGYAFKSDDLKNFGDDSIIKIKNISNKQVDIINTQFVSKTVSEKIDLKFKVKSGNVLIAMTGAEVGKIGLVPKNDKDLWLNQRVGNFIEKIESAKWFVFLILVQDGYQSLLFSSASGSAQPNISASQIEDIEITLPNMKTIEEFGIMVNPFFEKILENQHQIRTLAHLRDTLLPKLMSGAVGVKNETL